LPILKNIPTNANRAKFKSPNAWVRILGPEHDLEIAITRYGLPTQFHPGALSEADLLLEKHRREVDKTLAANTHLREYADR
jgi:hypothetical protein